MPEKKKLVVAKCYLGKNNFYEWCTAMDTSLNPEANSGGKGLDQVNLFNLETGKTGCLGVRYKQTSHDKGIMLNLCPWCGKKILNKNYARSKK